MKNKKRTAALSLLIAPAVSLTILLSPVYTVTASASAPASESKPYIEYIIQKGDTLGEIAEGFGTTVASLKALNGLSSDMIYYGRKLKVPAIFYEYKVKSGDTLYKIGLAAGVPYKTIMEYSGITDTTILVGQILKIPGSTPKTESGSGGNTGTPSGPSVSYTDYYVKRGDTIWDISVTFGIPMTELLSDNGLNMESSLSIGQKLKIAQHTVPVKQTPGAKYGEYLNWWTEAQYVVPIGKTIKIVDFTTGKSFSAVRTIGAGHADCEPCRSSDTTAALSIFGAYTWTPRAVIVEIDGRRIAGSASFYPHDIQSITNNNFNGHFDLYFANCIRHADGMPDPNHQKQVEIAAGR